MRITLDDLLDGGQAGPADPARGFPGAGKKGPVHVFVARPGGADPVEFAGRSAQAQYERRLAAWKRRRTELALRWIPAAAAAGAVGGGYLGWSSGVALVGVVFGLLVVGAVSDVVCRMPPGVREWKAAAAGERATARLLERTAHDGYLAFHDRTVLPGGAGAAPAGAANRGGGWHPPGTGRARGRGRDGGVDVEHLLVGPAGIFLVDSRHWSTVKAPVRVFGGRLWIDRTGQDELLAQLRREAAMVGAEVGAVLDAGPVPVACLLVVHGKRVDGAPRMVGGVAVVEASQLLRYLSRLEQVWGPDRVSRVALAAEKALAGADDHLAARPGG